MGGGQLADLVFTDPPYNVAYSGRGEVNSLGTIQNDNMCDTEFDDFISRTFFCCYSVMKDVACIYVAHPDSKPVVSCPYPLRRSGRWTGAWPSALDTRVRAILLTLEGAQESLPR